jgi:calcineurin-like phosphoesterase family protein
MKLPNRVFVISDTHFGHRKILDFESEHRKFGSIEEHDEELVRRWNDTVGRKDTVYHLGDVLFGSAAFSYLARLNGVKHLVAGNHDNYPTERYLQHFNSVSGVATLHGYVMSHVPVHPDQFCRFKGNIHGHLHSKTLEDPRYINVSAEQTGLAPILLDTVIHQASLLQSEGL